MNPYPRTPLALFAALLLAGCGSRQAAVDPPRPAAAVRAYVDPATGRLREPTAQELAAPPAAAAGRPGAQAVGTRQTEVEFAVPGGGYGLRPAQPLSTEEQACVLPDGRLRVDCSVTESQP